VIRLNPFAGRPDPAPSTRGRLRVGIACPYSWEVPGGVQFHVRDLALTLRQRGHEVSVIAPADEDSQLPDYVVPAGRAVPVPYNGSVARLAFGVLSATRVRRWLAEGRFDVLHVHEPACPSVSMLACWAASGPIVATFHTSNERSRTMAAAFPILSPTLEKVSARIAVSEQARATLAEHVGLDSVVIPNGVFVDQFAVGSPNPQWQNTLGSIGFLGRYDEPRKGLEVFLQAMEQVVATHPGISVLIAGRGDEQQALANVSPALRSVVRFLGQISDSDKISLFQSLDLYVAPNLGGESFGIILAEAMAAHAAVVASDLDSFRDVLDGGKAGALFPTGSSAGLAQQVVRLLDDPAARQELTRAADRRVARFDWGRVADEVLAVYETVVAGAPQVSEDVHSGRLARWRAS
jgi:phosphatidylinositol alpha-mannosyltransferase